MYADFTFYVSTYGGALITDATEFEQLASRADLEINKATDNRLEDYPPEERYEQMIAITECELADELKLIRMAGEAVANNLSASGSGTGAVAGDVASITSGEESISYSSSGAISAGRAAYVQAATDPAARERLLYAIILRDLSGVPDARGINLTYKGA